MFQLPMLVSGAAGLLKGSGPDRADAGIGLEGLLQAADGAMGGFSGDLQAMLMQMTPQMLQRLEELLGGGMNLPQAAKTILAESGFDDTGTLFSDFMKEGLPGLEEPLAAEHLQPPTRNDGTLVKMAEGLLDRGGPLSDLVQTMSGAAPAAAMPSPVPVAQANPLSPQLAASLLDMGVPQQVGGKAWEGAIADRIMWMVQGEQQFAKLQLNPPNLGPLEVRISVNHDQASVSFTAQHAAVREALEAAMPRLREMFDQQSMQLVRADVSDPGAQHGDRAQDSSGRAAAHPLPGGDELGEDVDMSGAQTIAGTADSLIDLFA